MDIHYMSDGEDNAIMALRALPHSEYRQDGTAAKILLEVAMQIGSKVKVIEPIDNYPDCYIEPGETGTLTKIDSEGAYWVKLDAHHPELSEWDNQVQIWDWSEQNPDWHPSYSLAVIKP